MNKKLLAIAAYAAVGVFSFGHAANWRWNYNDEAVCLAGEDYSVKVGCDDLLPAPISGIFAATLWPLYWSWVLQS